MQNSSMEIKIGGMHCHGCAQNIGRALKLIDGVVKADVNFAESKANLEVAPGKVTREQLEKAIEKAGFSVLK